MSISALVVALSTFHLLVRMPSAGGYVEFQKFLLNCTHADLSDYPDRARSGMFLCVVKNLPSETSANN